MSATGGAVEAVRRFVDAFNAEDLDAFVDLLHPQVAIEASRGVLEGHDAARGWATRNPTGELQQRLRLLEAEEVRPGVAVARLRRQWYWRAGGETADEEELFYLARIRDGLVASWERFEEREAAVAAARAERSGSP